MFDVLNFHATATGTFMAGQTILIVDDDPTFRTSLADILNRAGYSAHGAADGRSAISLAGNIRRDVDLLVVEMALPDMSGVTLIEAIAEKQKTNIKVIASSSIFSQADLETQTAFHSDAGIRKDPSGTPAIAARWLSKVRSLLGELAEATPAPRHEVVLLFDDNNDIRHFVKTILNEGYQVLEAANGNSALALAQKLGGAVDILITDIEMPGMDGCALGKAIREEYSAVPIIYISGFTEKEHLHDPAHGFAFIGKPFQPKVLLEGVSRMLGWAG
jgi:CheY-like chemotaxis protein